MSAVSWVRWLLAAAMLAVALYHLVRLVRRRHGGADLDLAHASMGAAMTAMLLGAPTSVLVPIAFAGGGGWFVVRTVRAYVLTGAKAGVGTAQAAVGCTAMVFMLAGPLGAPPVHAMGGMAMAGSATASGPIGLALIVATLALAAWTIDGPGARPSIPRARPRLALGCQLAMNVTTVAMLALR